MMPISNEVRTNFRGGDKQIKLYENLNSKSMKKRRDCSPFLHLQQVPGHMHLEKHRR